MIDGEDSLFLFLPEQQQQKSKLGVTVMDAAKISPSSVIGPQEASNHDELFMQQSLHFSESLKDLKNLRNQLYSAADYFETSYVKEDQKHLLLQTFKDYTVKALINSIDHLGHVVDKISTCLDEKIGEVSAMELQFCCSEQRMETCQEYINRGGLSDQCLVINTPKHHKHYILPDNCRTPSPSLREQDPIPQPSKHSPGQGAFELNSSTSGNKKPGRRALSPQRFPLIRSASILRRSVSPDKADARRRHRYPSAPKRSTSLSARSGRDWTKEIEQDSGKSKRHFKGLLSFRKIRKDSGI